MLNKVILMGRLTRDPELRYTQSNTPVCSFSVAVERTFNRDETDFIDIVAWRKTGEFVSKYFAKGAMIAIEGSLQTRKWQDKNGNNRVSVEVNADQVYFCGGKKQDGGNAGGGYAGGFEEFEDDVPLPF